MNEVFLPDPFGARLIQSERAVGLGGAVVGFAKTRILRQLELANVLKCKSWIGCHYEEEGELDLLMTSENLRVVIGIL